MRKFWQIKGTDTFSEVKSELKQERNKLNIAAGINLKTEPASQWPYKITKGPDHPHVSPYFREVRIGDYFSHKGFNFKKTAHNQAHQLEDGVLSVLPKTFHSDWQVQASQ